MIKLQVPFVWLGGALFVGALAYCGYSYAFAWGRMPPFHPGALPIDAVLFTIFACHHSVFARDSVKHWLSRTVPEPLLRSVYVWTASALLIVMCAAWRPIGAELYRHTGLLAAAHAAVQIAGVAIIAQSVRAIDALELAGIHQPPPFLEASSLQTGGLYGWVRHPLYSGWLLLTFGTAHMTGDRLFFAGIAAVYLLIAMPFEERSLRTSFGESYARYQRMVCYRLVPYVY
ncbi:MAG TPA: isoprenylcysteine carboxylmethyltransferase family protein [Vicinamibacterales bacterium]|nr:isoprenylcysteine carboxylmethyltransferase family protein [Vicinamibacterales bacterium]